MKSVGSAGSFRFEMVFGSVRVEQTQRLEGGRIVMGGRATRYGKDGEVLSVTESDNCSMGWDDGSPMTAADYDELTHHAQRSIGQRRGR